MRREGTANGGEYEEDGRGRGAKEKVGDQFSSTVLVIREGLAPEFRGVRS
jgi:hypothetical protein